jgi:RND family efflux transporter MFP subunit
LVLLGTLFGMLLALPAAAAPGGRAAPVKVAEARLVLLAPQAWIAGTVISRHEARVAFEVPGRLVSVAEVGTRADENQIVASIDPTFIKLKVEEYEATVARERARLAFFKQEMQRLNRLAKQDNAAQTQLDQTRADREVARNDLRIAHVRLRQAREELTRHQLRTPFAGVVAERLRHPGERVAVGDEVLRLTDDRMLEVQARVPLDTRGFVQVGDKVTVRREVTSARHDGVGRDIEARVTALVTVGDSRSRLLDLRLAVSGDQWTVGQPVRVALPTAAPREVLAVPRDALVLRRAGAAVFRVRDEETADTTANAMAGAQSTTTAEHVPITLGVSGGELIEIRGDLQPGDRVVVRGGERLRPGQAVNILLDTPSVATPPSTP